MVKTTTSNYLQSKVQRGSIENPGQFWLRQAHELLDWAVKPTQALSTTLPGEEHKAQWFPGGYFNMCYNTTAVIYDSPVTDTVKKYTYDELLREIKAFAAVLKGHGVTKSDVVLLYMTMVPQTLIAMLACVRLGAVHSVVFGGFAPPELAKRIKDCLPKIILTNTLRVIAYKPLLDAALRIAEYTPDSIIVLQREQLRVELDAGKARVAKHFANSHDLECVPVESNHPLYTLYTSGTTGMPKGVVRPTASHAVSLLYAQRNMYGLRPGETMFTMSDFGWALGHSYSAYAPLLNGSTTILYEGKPVGTPDAGQVFRVFAQHKVNVFLCAPTVIVVLRCADSQGQFRQKYDLSHMRGLFLAGERCAPEVQRWWMSLITGKPVSSSEPTVKYTEINSIVSDHWWQTESGMPLTGICIGMSDRADDLVPVKYGSAGLPLPGANLKVVRVKDAMSEDADAVDPTPEYADLDEVGNIVLKLPLPPGFFSTLWNDDKRFYSAYFRRYPGYYDTGDTGMIDKDGYVHILSRTDDVIKVAAHRLSTSSIEEVVFEHSEIAECCVVPHPDSIKGSVPMLFAVLRFTPPHTPEDVIREEIVSLARARVGPIVSLYSKNIVFVKRLPKTRSGKILRKMIRMMIDSVHNKGTASVDECPIPTPATIDDATIKTEIWQTIVSLRSE
ncbi:AMP-dependent synthetase and ligase [Linderina pennispora]|uniref:AMP-dependent synthetase and ligase n=1 Tax=Linderina pennispora TaxID=61395 RepID=A0A1Y1WEM2_9FUNG|nr:AMP-dependent synthetase and ligase [Linderina pennispora]ORX71922.1 AMP-dependent synthetase and ligase [Linderina pennispora]